MPSYLVDAVALSLEIKLMENSRFIDQTIQSSHSNSSPVGRNGNETAKVSKLFSGPELNHVPKDKAYT